MNRRMAGWLGAACLLTGAAGSAPANPVGGPDVQLPEAYEVHRVLGKVNLGKAGIRDAGPGERCTCNGCDDDLFNTANALVAAIGPGVAIFQRHCKTGDEGPWWLSASGPPYVDDACPRFFHHGENLVAKMDAQASAVGQQTFYYYRHMDDAHYAGIWQDGGMQDVLELGEWDPSSAAELTWIARRRFGANSPATYPGDIPETGWPWNTNRGIWLCVNSPYREVVKTRVEELAAAEGIGIHFDFKHNPPQGCFCQFCEAAWVDRGWEQTTGLGFAKLTSSHPLLMDFYSESVRLYFEELTSAARAVDEQFIMGIKAAELAAIGRRGLRTANAAVADILMLEYGQATGHPVYPKCGDPPPNPLLYEPGWSVKWGLGWSLTRDATYGRPPKVVLDVLSSLDTLPEPDAQETRALAGALLTFGCTALLTYPGLGEPATKDIWTPSHQLGAALAPAIGHTRPRRWVGILFPESALVFRGWNRSGNPTNAATVTIYREIVAPIFGAIELLQEKGAPWGIVTEEQLLEYSTDPKYLSAFAHIIVPVADDELTAEHPRLAGALSGLAATVIHLDGRFPVAEGGNGAGNRWDGYPDQSQLDRETLKERLWNNVLDADPAGPPVWVDETDAMQVSAQFLRRPGDTDTLVMLTQRWDWAMPSLIDCAIEPPAPASGCRVNVRSAAAPSAYQIDLVTGAYAPLAIQFDPTTDAWYCDVPDFEQLAAILLDEADRCPWDCAGSGDGLVDTFDFLALLAQWGQVGAPCDFDGSGVDGVDFLTLLEHWGPCP